jgi:hypothetical protein
MNENQADPVDKEMFSLAKEALELQSHKYIFKDGAWHRLWEDKKKQILLAVVNKLIEMDELIVKRKLNSKNKISSFEEDEIDYDQLISMLKMWKRIKEANEYKHIEIDYVLEEELGQAKIL